MTNRSSKARSDDQDPAGDVDQARPGTDPAGDVDHGGTATLQAAASPTTPPTPGRMLLVQARNPDTNGLMDVPAMAILPGDPADDGSVTVDVMVFDLGGTRRATVQLYANRDDALASDRPDGQAAWWPSIPGA